MTENAFVLCVNGLKEPSAGYPTGHPGADLPAGTD